ncbi:MAG: hypothetical protein QM608_04860, partial [Caulobacter sp.]
RVEGETVSVGQGAVATTQLRQKGGPRVVMLEPILQPGSALRVVGGKVVIAPAKPGDKGVMFRRVRGLAGQGVSFEATPGVYLMHRDGAVVAGRAGNGGAQMAATFLVS